MERRFNFTMYTNKLLNAAKLWFEDVYSFVSNRNWAKIKKKKPLTRGKSVRKKSESDGEKKT